MANLIAEARAADFGALASGLGVVLQFRPGDAVFSAGEAPHCMYIVLDGEIEVSGADLGIQRVGRGRALGVLSMLDGGPRTTTARVVGDKPCAVAALNQQRMRYMVESVPLFVWYVMGELGSRQRATIEALERPVARAATAPMG